MNRATFFAAIAWALVGLSGCGEENGVSPLKGPLHGELSVDIRERVSVTIHDESAQSLEVALNLTKGYGVAPVGVEMTGAGRAEALPEANVTLYTARIDAPADPSGPCGAEPVSLALSLHRRGDAPRFAGSLTAYCGKGVWHGNPARLLRLAGELTR